MSQGQILEALAALSAEIASDAREELLVMGGAALVPGRELKATYAFDDLWEERDGST
jgi:hypothetical protein